MNKPDSVIFSHELPGTALSPEQRRARQDKIQIAMISLCGCWGCSLSLLDMDERLLPLLDKVTINRSSFTDIKRIPVHSAIGFVEGGVANEENIETLEHFREHCDILISVGACAIWGGVPSMRNMTALESCVREAYIDSVTVPEDQAPTVPYHEDIPRITQQVYPLHEVVKVDYYIPGCPPDGDVIHKVLDDLVNGRPFSIPANMNRYD